ncbi:MAG: YadA domain-containing structural protein [Candidatus Giovannonibacteria bacterium GW2011_GWB1_45_9b]|uniref:YadA domain-containing structural protein n=1 Tax=Candidatus Giovannonibacteria bacterium GW2011_GWB1_45_9b TaxID=1618653 RepID=A0A0G1N5H4_9BACT|nr:MAG: YadA domain-containing structural protein [Candidatus Giovannonibacteria bacterium GW2011_GWB1_45_9b]
MKGGHEGHSRIFEEFERLNPQIVLPKPPLAEKEIFAPPQAGSTKNLPQAKVPTVLLRPFVSEQSGSRSSDISFAARPQSELSLPDKKEISQNVVLEKLDKLSDSLTTFAGQITQKINEPSAPAQPQNLNEEQQEFIAVQSRSLFYRLKKFNIFAKQSLRSPAKMMAVMVSAIVLLFILAGGFSFGQVDYVVQQVKKAFKDADTVQGHFPGTHANEVLVLDKAGNISIFGHIETQGQLRSHAPDGVAPITVDSVTKVENLNSDYLDGLDSKDFTLAFVTKNGNITYEDVFLEGTVEVGKTLTVKGATKLLDSLTVYGALGVFSDAVFGKNVTLTKGNLVLEKGTIQIFNQSLIKNLNAEFLDGVRKGDISLDFVTSNGSSTGNSITVGGLRVKGESNFDAQAFFNQGLWGLSGSFGSLGVAGDVSIGDPDNSDSKFEVYSKKFSVDSDGNTNIKGTGTIANLKVGGKVLSDLIPSGSFDLGSSTNRWQNVFEVPIRRMLICLLSGAR